MQFYLRLYESIVVEDRRVSVCNYVIYNVCLIFKLKIDY